MQRLEVLIYPSGGGYNMKILVQTHRNIDFGTCKRFYCVINGREWVIESCDQPEFRSHSSEFFVQGECQLADDIEMYVPDRYLPIVKELVARFNEYYK